MALQGESRASSLSQAFHGQSFFIIPDFIGKIGNRKIFQIKASLFILQKLKFNYMEQYSTPFYCKHKT